MEETRVFSRYLQAIWALQSRYFFVRSVDVARYLQCSKAAVSMALKQLVARQLVVCAPDGALSLTPEGEDRARQTAERCACLCRWLIQSGVAPSAAEQEACAIERILSPASYEAIRRSLEIQAG